MTSIQLATTWSTSIVSSRVGCSPASSRFISVMVRRIDSTASGWFIANTTIVGNTASGVGGGYEGSGGGTHDLTNVTIDGNGSGSGGGNVDG